jgi:predicted ester cyclase
MTHPLIQESIDKRPFVRELLSQEPDDYQDVRELWKAHSKAEDARDIAGLMATLTDDCVYELVQTGHRWEGHEGATRFYVELLTAFPDIDFALTSIIVGPQGVCEEAVVNGTHSAPWLGVEPTGEKLVWRNVIFFPWDPEKRLFTGERVYTFFPGLGDHSVIPGQVG